jgi:hypothetical protein
VKLGNIPFIFEFLSTILRHQKAIIFLGGTVSNVQNPSREKSTCKSKEKNKSGNSKGTKETGSGMTMDS